MKSSRRKHERRRFFDVAERDTSRVIEKIRRFFGWEKVLNLKPRFYRRYPIRGVAVVLIIVLVGFSSRQFFISAQSATFYPISCLGNWENAQEAQHEPESAVSSTIFINEDNAAHYRGENEKIFCGKFLPDNFKSPGTLKSVALTLALQVGDATIPPGQQGIIEVSSTTSEIASSTSENIPEETPSGTPRVTEEEDIKPVPLPASEPEEVPLPVTTPAIEETPEPVLPQTSETSPAEEVGVQPVSVPKPEESIEPTSFLNNWLIPRVWAQETDSIPVADIIPEPEEVVPLGPPIIATLEAVSSTDGFETSTSITTTTIIVETSTEVVVPPPPPDENFLAISYSLNGEDWHTIGRINKNNWNLFTVSIPVASWTDLEDLQISIEGIPTTEPLPLPKILLDGMFLGAQYEGSLLDELLDLGGEGSNNLDRLRVFPAADSARLEEAQRKISSNFPGAIILSQQFEVGSQIVFRGNRGDGDQIFLFDSSSGQMKQITFNNNLKSEPVLIPGYAAWNEADSDPEERGLYGEVLIYDVDGGTITQLTKDLFTDHLPYFEDGFLVWDKIDAQSGRHIFRYDLESQEITQKDKLIFENTPLPETFNND